MGSGRCSKSELHWLCERTNKCMGGVNDFDHLISSYKILVLFYDLLEVAIVNSFTLMKEFMSVNPGVIQRKRYLNQKVFRANLIRQLARIEDTEAPPVKGVCRKRKRKSEDAAESVTAHCPVALQIRRNCAVCWKFHWQQVRSRYACAACQSSNGNQVHLCIQEDRNCFQEYHTREYRMANL